MMRSTIEISDAGKIAAIQEILNRMHMTENQFFEQAADLLIHNYNLYPDIHYGSEHSWKMFANKFDETEWTWPGL